MAAPAFQTIDEPEALLRGRQRQTLSLRQHLDLRQDQAPPNSGSLSQRAPTVGCSNSMRNGSSRPRAERTRLTTRVASSECPPKLEEAVSDAEARNPQHLFPDLAQPALQLRARRHVAAAPVVPLLRRRQGTAVHLAVRGQRQRLEPHEHRRHHVLRQPRGQMLAQARHLRRAPLLGHHIGHQTLVSAPILARGDHRIPH